MSNSTAVALMPNQRLADWLDNPEAKSKIGTALGKWMDDETFVSQMMIAFQREDLKGCSEASKFKAIHDCAALALLPSLQHVALLPRNMKVKVRDANGHVLMVNGKPKTRDEWQVCIMPQWQGYQCLMLRNAVVSDVTATIVFKGDKYSVDSNQDIVHEYDPFDANREVDEYLSNVVGGYLRIKYHDDRCDKIHYVTARQIRKSRSCAQTLEIWKSWPTQMVLKTIYRDAYARRAVPIDTMNNIAIERMRVIEDRTLRNQPNRNERLSALNDAPKTKSKSVTQLLDASHEVIEPEASEVAEPEGQPETQADASNLLTEFVEFVGGLTTQRDVKQAATMFQKLAEDDGVKADIAAATEQRINELKQAA